MAKKSIIPTESELNLNLGIGILDVISRKCKYELFKSFCAVERKEIDNLEHACSKFGPKISKAETKIVKKQLVVKKELLERYKNITKEFLAEIKQAPTNLINHANAYSKMPKATILNVIQELENRFDKVQEEEKVYLQDFRKVIKDNMREDYIVARPKTQTTTASIEKA